MSKRLKNIEIIDRFIAGDIKDNPRNTNLYTGNNVLYSYGYPLFQRFKNGYLFNISVWDYRVRSHSRQIEWRMREVKSVYRIMSVRPPRDKPITDLRKYLTENNKFTLHERSKFILSSVWIYNKKTRRYEVYNG